VGLLCQAVHKFLLGAEAATPASIAKNGKIRVGEIGCGSVSGSYLPNPTSKLFIRGRERVVTSKLIEQRNAQNSSKCLMFIQTSTLLAGLLLVRAE